MIFSSFLLIKFNKYININKTMERLRKAVRG